MPRRPAGTGTSAAGTDRGSTARSPACPTGSRPGRASGRTADGRLVGVVHPEGPDEVLPGAGPGLPPPPGRDARLGGGEPGRGRRRAGPPRAVRLGLRPAAPGAAAGARVRGAADRRVAASPPVRRVGDRATRGRRPATACGAPARTRSTPTPRGWPRCSTPRSGGRSTRRPSTGRSRPASPSFRHDLNLVAEAGDGSFAAHVGLTLDEANGHGIVEPVCTHPGHRRHGLAQALILDGLRRLRDLGASTCSVETGDMEPANALYRSIGFTEEYRGHTWRAGSPRRLRIPAAACRSEGGRVATSGTWRRRRSRRRCAAKERCHDTRHSPRDAGHGVPPAARGQGRGGDLRPAGGGRPDRGRAHPPVGPGPASDRGRPAGALHPRDRHPLDRGGRPRDALGRHPGGDLHAAPGLRPRRGRAAGACRPRR